MDRIEVHTNTALAKRYYDLHQTRIANAAKDLAAYKGKKVAELGGHPWLMTTHLLEQGLNIIVSVSAEEDLFWPDELPVTRRRRELYRDGTKVADLLCVSANLERTKFEIGEQVDVVLACEIMEHLQRAPHVLLLNANSWLSIGGVLYLTTPNGAQFSNPFRRKPRMNAFRCHIYERHTYLFLKEDLVDLIRRCGFEIEICRIDDPYKRSGIRRLYALLGLLPIVGERFRKQIVIVARKVRDASKCSGLPTVYAPDPGWEHVDCDAVSIRGE